MLQNNLVNVDFTKSTSGGKLSSSLAPEGFFFGRAQQKAISHQFKLVSKHIHGKSIWERQLIDSFHCFSLY